MWAIYQRELRAFFSSLIAYMVIGVFLVANGLFLWVLPDNILEYGFAEPDSFFTNAPYIFMFLIPAVTMRSFAEEIRTGTIEILLTKPISTLQIVCAKYLAACMIVILSLIPTGVYVYTLYALGSPVGNLDAAGITGSYIGLFLLAFVFVAVGVFASALVDNQVTSFIVALVLCYILYQGFEIVSAMVTNGAISNGLVQCGIAYHYNSLSKGLIDSKDVLFFFGVIGLFLYATVLRLELRNGI